MKSLQLTIVVLCQVVLASLVFYFATSLAAASPLVASPVGSEAVVRPVELPKPVASGQQDLSPAAQQFVVQPAAQAVAQPALQPLMPVAQAPPPPAVAPAVPVGKPGVALAAPVQSAAPAPGLLGQKSAPTFEQAPEAPAKVIAASKLEQRKDSQEQPAVEMKEETREAQLKSKVVVAMAPESPLVADKAEKVSRIEKKAELVPKKEELEAKMTPVVPVEPVVSPPQKQLAPVPEPRVVVDKLVDQAAVIPQPEALVASFASPEVQSVGNEQQIEPRSQPVEIAKAEKLAESSKLSEVKKEEYVQLRAPVAEPLSSALVQQSGLLEKSKVVSQKVAETSLKGKLVPVPESAKPAPPVNGGLGPLHLLATTLCSYQPDRPVADDQVNQLYARRAIVRKSLFEFMSLKFTNLEKLSSRLGVGLQVVPLKSVPDPNQAASKPSHGWPVVGICTAHDLKLMGEAAWCECQDCSKPAGQQQVAALAPSSDVTSAVGQASADVKPDKADSKQKSARSIDTIDSFSPEQSSVISKILHVGDIQDAPVVESNFYNLNLTQHQLATLEAQATSTQECRRNALRYSKVLFQHLAEDQQSRSESWPKLYAQISADDCARKRIIDIFNALSSFRTDTTSIRRDNVEFAFAMDDLRTKVLENEVNIPLTFDRHFIEVEQFLQQSVRLMLASVQPKRAKLTSMRYRNLMYGPSSSSDDQQQCIDLHQRLLAKTNPSDCNPTQFGQLPDVLRMTANSLELWSIEKELSLNLAKIADYPNVTPFGQQKVKEDVNECIANLVAS